MTFLQSLMWIEDNCMDLMLACIDVPQARRIFHIVAFYDRSAATECLLNKAIQDYRLLERKK